MKRLLARLDGLRGRTRLETPLECRRHYRPRYRRTVTETEKQALDAGQPLACRVCEWAMHPVTLHQPSGVRS